MPRDCRKATTWYKKAAEKGQVNAQTSLRVQFYRGDGVLQDFIEALLWFRKSAREGHHGGQYFLGRMYENGEGVPQNVIQAYGWLDLSAAQGHEPARVLRDKLRSRMSRVQIKEAQELSHELDARIGSR